MACLYGKLIFSLIETVKFPEGQVYVSRKFLSVYLIRMIIPADTKM